MKTITIFGSCGFVGANLAFYFMEKGYKVTAVDNLVRRGSEYNLPSFRKNGIEFVHGDVRNREDFRKIPYADIILECSAQPSATEGYDNPYFDISNNTLGLINVLEWARKQDSIVIFWSTNKVFSGDKINALKRKELETRFEWDGSGAYDFPYPKGFNPYHGISNKFDIDGGQHSLYGLSKIMSDLACQEYVDAFHLKTVVNRFSCLAGQKQWGKSAQGWVAWWAIAVHFDLPLTYIGWKGKQVRDVLFIDDICKLVELEINNIDIVAGDVFNIGGGMENTLSLIEATQLMEKKFKKKITPKIIQEPRKADHCIYISDIRKAEKLLGWKPKIEIEEGYEDIIKWVKDHESMLRSLYL